MLTDLERVPPCMPGFELQEADGGEYHGVVKVKVGPMVARYKRVASFRERDATNHRAVVRAEGRETRGPGNAAATVTATLAPQDGGTRVTLHTDLTITGRVAQSGRGVLADVSSIVDHAQLQARERVGHGLLAGSGHHDQLVHARLEGRAGGASHESLTRRGDRAAPRVRPTRA